MLDHHVRIADGFTPLDEVALQALRDKYADRAGDGHLELYKSTAKNDADEGRAQHGFPDGEARDVVLVIRARRRTLREVQGAARDDD